MNMSYHTKHNNGKLYTEEEKAQIIEAYRKYKGTKKTDWLDKLAKELGRDKHNISRFAKRNHLVKQKWTTETHPRGMLGKKHSAKTKQRFSERMTRDWANDKSIYRSKGNSRAHSIAMSRIIVKRLAEKPNSIYSRTQKGWVEFSDGKRFYFRSGWEMRYANYLEWLKDGKKILDWLYEPDTFWFENIRRGVRSYTPDFKVMKKNHESEYHEVKGWMDSKSKTKLKRMAKYYPEIKILLIDEPQFNAIMKWEKLFKKNPRVEVELL